MSLNIHEKIRKIDEKYLRKDIPDFKVGDTIKMRIKVQEADKIRFHPFEGIVIRKTGRGLKATFTVRKVAFGEGVEKIFPINSPVIESLSIVAKGNVKRAKLYYLRDRLGKKSRVEVEEPQQAEVNASV